MDDLIKVVLSITPNRLMIKLIEGIKLAKQRYVNTKFWSDNWVIEKLNPLDRYLFLYLLTNFHANILGIYEISLMTVAHETGIERDEVTRMVKNLEPGAYYIDGWIYLPKFLNHQAINPNIEKGIAVELMNVPPEIREKMLTTCKPSERLLKASNYLNNKCKIINLNESLETLTDDKKM